MLEKYNKTYLKEDITTDFNYRFYAYLPLIYAYFKTDSQKVLICMKCEIF